MRAESDSALQELQASRPLAPLGELLRRYRRAAGFTQEGLAERTGLTREAISLLERGARQRPHPYTVQALCAALNLSPADGARFAAAARASLDTPAPSMQPAAPASPFVGRAAELALIDRQLRGEGPTVLALAGEPGIGKSRLLAQARASAGGWTVLEGGCQRSGQDPYAPLVQAVQRHLAWLSPTRRRTALAGCAWLARLLPEVADLAGGETLPAWPLPPEQEQRLMFAAVGRFLSAVAGPAGTLLLLDDLQWAGADALDLLAALVHAAESPLRVIGAYRDTEAPPQSALATMLADLAHAGLIAHHTVQPLCAGEATQMLASVLEGSVDEDAVRRVVQRTGGVPFFLVSCAQGLRAGSRVAGADDVVPWDVAQSVRQRVAALSDDVKEVLGVAAVVGRVVPYALLSAACNLPAAAVAMALHAACGARLLEEVGADAYQFAHDVIREVIEADLGTARRLLLHGRIGQALERAGPAGADVEALAYHYGRSAEQDKAVLYLEQAGDHARDQYAHAAAVGYYGEAVRRLDGQGRALDAARVREKLGGVLLTAGQYDQALEVLEPAAESYQTAGDLDSQGQALMSIAYTHTARGTPEEPVERMQHMLALLEERGAWRGVTAMCLALANLFYHPAGRFGEHLAVTERAVSYAQRLGDDRLLAVARKERASALFKASRWEEALPAHLEAARLAEAAGALPSACFCLQTAAGIYCHRGEIDRQRANSDRAVATAERLGDPLVLVMMLAVRGVLAFWRGDWAQARADCEQAAGVSHVGDTWQDLPAATARYRQPPLAEQVEPVKRAVRPGLHVASAPLLYLGQLCLAEGDLPAAARYLEDAAARAVQHCDVVAIQSVLARLDLLAGRPLEAYARLAPLTAFPEPWEWWEWPVTPLRVLLAWAHLELHEEEQAAIMAAQAAERARAVPTHRALVEALWMQARVATRQQRWAQARRALDEGVALARRIQAPYAEGRLLYVYGQLQAALGEPGPARASQEAALAIFQRLGARADAALV